MIEFCSQTCEALGKIDPAQFGKVVDLINSPNRKYIVTFGNGGSHSTASHLANDLSKALGKFTICLGDMIASAYAYMNDDGKKNMFSHMLQKAAPVYPDLAIAISCSGNSPNVVQALKEFRRPKILFTGETGGEAKKYADVTILVPHPSIYVQESVHSVLCHAIIEALSAG